MRRRPTITFALCLALALPVLGVMACTSGEEAATEAQEAEWTALQEMKTQLDAKREELAELRQRLDELSAEEESTAEEPASEEEPQAEGPEEQAEGTGATEETGEPTREGLEREIARLEQDIADQSEEFMGRLVQHINSLGIVEGEPLTPDQKAAIRMKTEEDMRLAEEWIEKGGDYKRAISIYESALALDPDNQELQAALEEAREMRFMTEERFSAVEEGMSREEVREALGPVNLRNVQEYPDKNAVAWFYPKEGTSSPAAVWFRMDDETGIYEVYQADFDVETDEE